MTTAVENLNNAIATLGPRTAHSDTKVRKSILQLETHWEHFWHSSERAVLPDVALAPKLQRYVEWYTRAWMLLPPEERKLATSPGELDASWEGLATDTLKQHADSMLDVQKGAVELSRDIATNVVKPVRNYTLWVGGGVLLGLYLWSKRGRR